MAVHVVCIKHGTLYSADYVNKLYRAVCRNTTRDFDFTCYTDDRSGIDGAIRRMELPRKDLLGWWHKLFLFSPEFVTMVGPGQVLYLDLDTIIVGNIDEFLDFESIDAPLAILRDMGSWQTSKAPANCNWGSAIMSWQVGWGYRIWKSFTRDVGQEMRGHGHGDQGYIKYAVQPDDVRFWQDFLSPRSQVISYKWQIRDPNRGTPDPPVPDGTAVICFHGVPRPHEVTNLTFVQQHWK